MPVFRDVQTSRNDGWVAQLVEQRIENPRVDGSIPPPATTYQRLTEMWAFLCLSKLKFVAVFCKFHCTRHLKKQFS